MVDRQSIDAMIQEKSKKWEKRTIAYRHVLHEYPEISGEEYHTSEFLKQEVKRLGLKIEGVPNSTGFIAILDTGKQGKVIGIRTDIDGLPITENPHNLNQKRKVVSKNKGIMHACGHDGHMAVLLTAMNILWEMRENLKGKIYFIFEEGEETNTGIAKMICFLANKKMDVIYGNHFVSFLDSGKICVDPGPQMAGAMPVRFTIYGKSGHGSRPDLAVNPIFATTQILNGLTNAWANQIDVTKTVTLGITQIHGGSTYNIIPDQVTIDGSLRFFDEEEGKKAGRIIKKIASLTAEAHNCKVEFSDSFKVSLRPVCNDEKMTTFVSNSIQKILPNTLEKNVTWFASETFNRYSELAPIVFAFIGTKNEDYGSGAEHHNPRFDLDDKSLLYGVTAMVKIAYDFLNQE